MVGLMVDKKVVKRAERMVCMMVDLLAFVQAVVLVVVKVAV